MLLVFLCAQGAWAQEQPVTVHLFWQEGCPHCEAARQALEPMAAANDAVALRPRQLEVSDADNALFLKLITLFEHNQVAVPFVVIGARSFLGYREDGSSDAQYRDAIDVCLRDGCLDAVDQIEALSAAITGRPATALDAQGSGLAPDQPQGVPDQFHIPLIGPVSTAGLSLRALTVVMAAIDGFNPCAMWVLVFLIGLLLGLKDMWRMWVLGFAFLAATGVMYFAVMAAWLNVVLYLSAIAWVRLVVAALAVGGGLYYLREYWTKPEGVCRVTDASRRSRIMTAFRTVVNDHPMPLAIVGIMGLAVLVNFIELLCSAGIPAVYTQMLALNDLPTATYYGYLLLYIVVFMLDDMAIFATAMLAVRAAGLTGSYARYSHLIGGGVLLVIGAVMALRPDLLAFA